jgi:hypothetical protein
MHNNLFFAILYLFCIYKKARRKDPDELKYKTKWTHEMVSYNNDNDLNHVDNNDGDEY